MKPENSFRRQRTVRTRTVCGDVDEVSDEVSGY